MWESFVYGTKVIGGAFDKVAKSHKKQTGIFSWDDSFGDFLDGLKRGKKAIKGEASIITDEEMMIYGVGALLLIYIISK